FQAEDGIRDLIVTGVQTCALPISFHRELGLLLWDKCGMSRHEKGLREALRKIPELRNEFWRDVRVPGDEEDYNQSLERAGRVAEIGRASCRERVEIWGVAGAGKKQ